MTPPTFDIAIAHRWFAVEFNNRAWSLVEQPARTDDETERMIHMAHASLQHWCEAGTGAHRMRALCLVATAYVAAGRGEEAVREALRCVAMSERGASGAGAGEAAGGEAATVFDVACAHACAAAALELTGAISDAAGHRLRAREWAVRCDADERRLLEKLYGPTG